MEVANGICSRLHKGHLWYMVHTVEDVLFIGSGFI